LVILPPKGQMSNNINNFVYSVIETTITVEEKEYPSYGIKCTCGNELIKVVTDISIEKSDVQSLVRKINEGGLSPEQLEEIAEDSLI